MKSLLKTIGIAMSLLLVAVACDSSASIQQYYVDSKENAEFISVDLPASIVQVKDDKVSDEVKATLETIKKVNFLALQLNDDNKNVYAEEMGKVKEILKNPKYKELARFQTKGAQVRMNYIGTEDAIDEVIIFGSDNTKGFALIRVLGENMNPSAILKISQNVKLDGSNGQLDQLGSLLSNVQ